MVDETMNAMTPGATECAPRVAAAAGVDAAVVDVDIDIDIDIDAPVPALANPVLDVIERRSSTRAFSDEPVTEEERHAILHAASRAPSAGAMMFYSVISLDDPELRREICLCCDDQPFMLKAPFWLLFAADNRKWLDLYEQTGCYDDPALASTPEHAGYRRPGLGDLLLACEDTMAAAQTAVIAAESLGIGSCYIGDVLENGERVAELLDLPEGTLPLALLVFGHKRAPRTAGESAVSVSCTVDDVPAAELPAGSTAPASPAACPAAKVAPQTPHPVGNLYMPERYHVPSAEERTVIIDELDAKFTPNAIKAGAPAGERVRKLYHRKHTSDFMAEMNRSAEWWFERWCGSGRKA